MKSKFFNIKKLVVVLCIMLLAVQVLPGQAYAITYFYNYWPAPNVTITSYTGSSLMVILPNLASIGAGDYAGFYFKGYVKLKNQSTGEIVYNGWATFSNPDTTANAYITDLSPTNSYELDVYYASENPSSGAWYYSTHRYIYFDTSPPTNGSIEINGGAAITASSTVSLTLYATRGSGYCDLTSMRFSNDGVNWSNWEAYSTSKSGWTLSSGDGTKTVYVQFRNAAGNISTTYSDTIILDTLPPTGYIYINNNSYSTNSTTATLNMHISDGGSGLSQMQFSNDNSVWSDWEPYNATKTWTLTSGDGPKTVYAKFKDVVGNVSNTILDTIVLDTVPPTGSISINGGASYTNSTNLSLTLSASDNNGQVSKMKFKIDSEAWGAPVDFATSYALPIPAGNGTRTVSVIFIDPAGNESAAYSDTIYVDTTAPTLSAVSINSGTEWTNSQTVSIGITASDANSGLYQMQFSNDNANWSNWEAWNTTKSGWQLTSGDGTKTVYVKVKDNAGNMSAALSGTIKMDTTKPTGTIVINDGDAKTGTQNVKVKVTASDNLSGSSQVRFSKDGTTWDAWTSYNPNIYYDYQIEGGTGPRYVYLQVKDNAGNISDPVRDDITLKDDNQGPVVSLKINNDAQLTTTQNISLTISAYDDLTPIEQLQMRFSNDGKVWSAWESVAFVKDWTLSSDEGQKNVFIQVKDASGNTTTAGDTIDYYVNPVEYNDTIQQTEVDNEPPVIKSVKISTGATILTSNSVPLSIVANDNMGTSGLKMSFSNNGTSWQTPIAYTAKYTVTGLSFSSGYNVLYVKVIDAYGNEAVDSIEFFKK